ncbi:MAG TPA: Zn-dependent alcohol dehydrogenase [Acidimicrobiia bacterium]|jgi:Zn-dependent alcohol dehydrogenase
MRAAVLEGAGQRFSIDDSIVVADPGPGYARVKVSHCGVCHSDLTAQRAAALTPVVLGHEASGVVDAVGEGVTLLAPGDKVVLTPIAPCGRCYFCVRGESGCCVNNQAVLANSFADGTTGLSRHGATVYRGLGVGGFAEYALCTETGAVKVPDDAPLDVVCVIGCAVQTGVGAVLNTARVEPGATVLVLGLGGIGQSVVQGARVAGASRIVASDPVAGRREAAGRLGATDVVDPGTEDVVAAVRRLTGVGADYAFECAGLAALAHVGIAATRPGGTTVLVGAPPVDQAITLAPAVLFGIQEKKLLGCFLGGCNSLRDIPRMVALWQAGQLDLEGLVTHRRPLAEVNDAFADLEAGRGIRTVLAL